MYTLKMAKLLGKHGHVSTPIVSMSRKERKTPDFDQAEEKKDGDDSSTCNHSSSSSPNNVYVYELFTSDGASVGVFDDIVFACHPPTAKSILSTMMSHSGKNVSDSDRGLLDLVDRIEYADNIIYVHSDPKLMPSRRRAWASWNCMGDSKVLKSYTQFIEVSNAKRKEAMEGSDSGFGNKANESDKPPAVGAAEQNSSDTNKISTRVVGNEGTMNYNEAAQSHPPEGGRMKAVYVTYWLNRLQNLKTDQDIFVSLNPHIVPDASSVHHVVHMAHPQFTPETVKARESLLSDQYQGMNGLWFCGAWEGYGFHEDGCRSGFNVATKLSGEPLPWAMETSATGGGDSSSSGNRQLMVLPPPDLSHDHTVTSFWRLLSPNYWHHWLTHDLPVAICKRFVFYFLNKAVKHGMLEMKLNDGTVHQFGDGTRCGCDDQPVALRVFDDWLFVKIAWEYDLGLSRSYMAGHFVIEPLDDVKKYDDVIRPPEAREETTTALGDPVGLTRLLMLLLGNRDRSMGGHQPRASYQGYTGANAVNAGLLVSKIGSFINFFKYRLTMDNSERGGSLKNIHAHYDISNDLFRTFLDKETLMYSSAVYDAVKAPPGRYGLVFRGSLEEAQWRKLDVLLDRAQIEPGQSLLDIGFGWGGLSLHAARKYGCQVTGITLSVEQKALAEERVAKEGLGHLITFEVVDYRKFARRKENCGKFDRVVSCEMIEAVGHEHLVEFFWAVEQVLSPNGVLVMEAITTTEERYENYLRSTDFINTIIFPGSCCPSLHALVDAAYRGSRLTLEHIDNIGMHYAQTLAEWRRRFNANEATARKLGFDDVFLRAWNYYLCYCEAGFYARNVNCLVLVFGRQGCSSLMALQETRSIVQPPALTDSEISNWLSHQS